MKKLNKKSGFTLVECVVAMAILAIMTLMLAMMMNIIVNLRNDNRDTEEDVDKQAEYLVNEQDLAAETLAEKGNIQFNNGIVIPGDNAEKVYYNGDPDSNVQIGAVTYDFGSVTFPEPSTEPGETTPTTPPEEHVPTDYKVYGSSDILNNKVNITEQSKFDNGDTTTATWRIQFTALAPICVENSVKVVFPNNAKITTMNRNGSNCITHILAQTTVKIQPGYSNRNTNKGSGNISVTLDVTFEIPKDEYQPPYEYFGQSSGEVDMNT